MIILMFIGLIALFLYEKEDGSNFFDDNLKL